MPDSPRLTPVQWLICVIASIGFAFDIYELLMLPLILPPALPDLLGAQPTPEDIAHWRGMMFFIPAFVGGIFGLLGGYLTDRLGRRRVLTWSILLYAVSAFAAGFSTSIYMLLFFRCTTFIGVCVEFVAAVAWLAELFPEPQRRERVLGYTQLFSSLGGLMVAFVNHWIVNNSASLPAIAMPEWLGFLGNIQQPQAAWRYTLMSGLIPAIPLVIIRPFLPESPTWKAKKDAGTLKRPNIAELFQPALLRTTIVTTAMFACSYGIAFGAIQQVPQIVPALPEVKAEVAEQTAELPADQVRREQRRVEQGAAAVVVKIQEVGGLIGRLIFAVIVTMLITRRGLLRIFLFPGVLILPVVFGMLATTTLTGLQIGMFLVGLFTVAQFSFWGNYLPRVYPIHLRGTGESFAANIGGRMIGTSFAWVVSELSLKMPGDTIPLQMAAAATIVGTSLYALNIVLSFFLPEPAQEALPD